MKKWTIAGCALWIVGLVVFITGLNLAGKKKEAALIARRFCACSQERGCILGFPPRTDVYPATGKPIFITPGPVASDGWPWSSWNACSNLTLITSVIPEGEEDPDSAEN